MRKSVCFILIFSGFGYAGQVNNDEVGGVAASFLQINPSVRAASLGGYQAALSGSIESMYSNPAALNSVSAPELLFSHNESLLDSQYETVGFLLPRKNQAFGFTAQYINDGTFEKVGDNAGAPAFGLGDFRHSTLALNTGWAADIAPHLSFGALFKGWRESVDGTEFNGWATDFGFHLRSVLDRFDFGLVARNLGPSIDGETLPQAVALGGALTLKHASLFAESELTSYRDPAFRTGLELGNKNLSLRAGFENLPSDLEDSLAQFTFGGGLRIKSSKFDYAWVPRGDLGNEHRVSVTFGFGLSETDRARVAKEVDRQMAQRMEERARSYFASGTAAFQKGDWHNAIDQLTSALEWKPENIAAVELLKAAREKQTFAQASKEHELGLKMKNQERWLEAALHFEKVLSFAPSHKAAAKELKSVKGKINEAPAQNADFLIEKAKRIAAEKEIERLKQAVHTDRDELDIMDQQANTLFTLGQTQKAIEMWKDILRRDPDRGSVREALKMAQRKKDVQDENASSTTARTVNELNAKAMAAYGEGELTTAAQLWKQSLRLDPQNVWTKKALSRVEMEMAGGER